LCPPDLDAFGGHAKMKKDYSEQLKSPKWQKKRLEIMQRDKFKCKLCGDENTTLHVHHKYYESGKMPWEYSNNCLITICEHCHNSIHILGPDTEIDYQYLKIIKSNNWVGGSYILFTIYKDKINMRIHDNNNKFMCGYNINDDCRLFKKIVKAYNQTSKYS